LIAKAARGLEGFSFEQFLGLFVEVGGLLPNGQVFESFVRHKPFRGFGVVGGYEGRGQCGISDWKLQI